LEDLIEKKKKRLSVKQASEDFFEGNVSPGMLYDLVKKNEIPHVKLSNGKILFDADALELWWQNKLLKPIHNENLESSGYGKLRKIKA
jgi:hypothetical protein